MAVYVDDMNMPADVPHGNGVVSGRWSHLMADSHEELMAAAEALRLNPAWIQHPGTPKEHFDLTSGKRRQAIKREIAQPVTWRQAGEMYAAKVAAQRAREAEPKAEELDYQAGCAFRDGDLDRARGILAQALTEHPGQRDLWESRLASVVQRAAAVRATVPEVPPVGVHRDGGPTTRALYGTFPRSPEPPPPHYCPGCTTVTERDGKQVFRGPQIEAHRELCQGCEVQASTQAREAPDRRQSRGAACDSPNTSYRQSCAKCGEAAPGPGGIICPPCREEIERPGQRPGRAQIEAAS